MLYGDMHVRAFDWAEPAPGGDPWAPRRATLVADRVIHVRPWDRGFAKDLSTRYQAFLALLCMIGVCAPGHVARCTVRVSTHACAV